MAVRAFAKRTRLASGFLYVWTGLLQGDSGAPVPCGVAHGGSLQVLGTFGGATLRLEGANFLDDPNADANWAVVVNPSMGTLDVVAASISTVGEILPVLMRPRVIGGDGTTDLTVRLRLAVYSAPSLM